MYLSANLRARRPFTKRARVEKKKHEQTRNKNKAIIIIIIIIIIKLISHLFINELSSTAGGQLQSQHGI
jgi:accessory gene regulator protein AgrB